MTREEAIARIKDHIMIHKLYERNAVKISDALEMAIKALEQPEPFNEDLLWERLERYADWFCAQVSYPEFVREAKAFCKSTQAAMAGGNISQPEPCEDAVSRKAVEYLLAHFVSEDKYVDAINDLRELPSVTPKVGTQMSLPECEDAVSRAKLQEKLQWIIDHGFPSSDGKHNLSAECVLEYVNSLPSVTPQPKTGKWIKIGEEAGALGITYAEVRCFNCGWSHSLIIPSNFCPNCGAKMEGRDAVN